MKVITKLAIAYMLTYVFIAIFLTIVFCSSFQRQFQMSVNYAEFIAVARIHFPVSLLIVFLPPAYRANAVHLN